MSWYEILRINTNNYRDRKNINIYFHLLGSFNNIFIRNTSIHKWCAKIEWRTDHVYKSISWNIFSLHLFFIIVETIILP